MTNISIDRATVVEMAQKLVDAKEALEYCARDGQAHPENRKAVARDALAKIWPNPPAFKVGKTYVTKSGDKFICIAMNDKAAWLARGETDVAYTWGLDGKSVSMTIAPGYDIDWSRTPL